MGRNDRDVPSLSICGALGARQVLRQEIGRTCDGHEGVPRLDLRDSLSVADHPPGTTWCDIRMDTVIRPTAGCHLVLSGQ